MNATEELLVESMNALSRQSVGLVDENARLAARVVELESQRAELLSALDAILARSGGSSYCMGREVAGIALRAISKAST